MGFVENRRRVIAFLGLLGTGLAASEAQEARSPAPAHRFGRNHKPTAPKRDECARLFL